MQECEICKNEFTESVDMYWLQEEKSLKLICNDCKDHLEIKDE